MIAKFVICFCLTISLLSVGCKASNSVNAPVVVLATEASILEVSSRAHTALNSGDLTGLTDVIAFPLVVRSHEWASTSGTYELTHPVDRVIEIEADLLSSKSLSEVRLESSSDEGGIISYEEVRENLDGSVYEWSDLTIIVYARGFGDVEHIVLFGVDTLSGKIKAIYYN